jgi:hypothetical protein
VSSPVAGSRVKIASASSVSLTAYTRSPSVLTTSSCTPSRPSTPFAPSRTTPTKVSRPLAGLRAKMAIALSSPPAT